MNTSDDPLLRAIRDARRETITQEIPSSLLEEYLRGTLGEFDQARVRAALAASAVLREELLALAEMHDEQGERRFAEETSPPAPPLRASRPRRPRPLRWAWAAMLCLCVAALALWRSAGPSALGSETWQNETPLREDQFLPLRLRDGAPAANMPLESARVAVTAALLECYEWDGELRQRIELPALDLQHIEVGGLDGLACFDPHSRALALLELPARAHSNLSISLPEGWGKSAVLVGWSRDGGGDYRAHALGVWER